MEFLVLVVLGILFGPLIISIVALNKTSGLTQQLARLRTELQDVKQQIGLPPEAGELGETRAEEPGPLPIEEEEKEKPAPEPVALSATTPPTASEGLRVAPTEEPAKSLEETLTSRWLVWLGAVAIGLGGTFLAKYAIDQGWLGPAIRVSLGFALGIALATGGEWLRRRPLQRAIAAIRPNYVPPALTASGLFTAFACVYAAYALHDLISPLFAFVGLAVVALAGVGLSLLQGRFVALLGLLGAFATPALIATPHPSAWALFSYLIVVQIACLAVLRYQSWWWLAFATLAGATLWPWLWMSVFPWESADVLPLGLYLTLMATSFLLLSYGLGRPQQADGWLKEIKSLEMPQVLSWVAAIAVSLLLITLVTRTNHVVLSLIFVALVSAVFLIFGRREQVFDGLAVVAGATVLMAMVLWQLPDRVTYPQPLFQLPGKTVGTVSGTPFLPIELHPFAMTGLGFAVLFGVAGFAALWGAKRPVLWAAASASMPVALLAIAYWRIVDFKLEFRWAAVALVFSLVSLLAATVLERWRGAKDLNQSLGFYCAAVVAFLSLGATMTLQQAWLTVALSVQLPALAWIHRRLNAASSIQAVAAVLAAVVLIRLILNYDVLGYPLVGHPVTSWVIYGYGIPALMFFWASRLFHTTGTVTLITLLQAGALVFATLLVSLEIRVLFTGSIDSNDYRLREQSLQTITWLSISYALATYHRYRENPVAFYGYRILLALAVAQIIIAQLWLSNPIFTQDPVGSIPVFNYLLLAYAVPAAFMFRLASVLQNEYEGKITRILASLGFILVFVYVTLEIRRGFHGSVLLATHQSDAELYAYSLAWLAFAGLLLALALYRKQSILRYASLVVLLITVLKVFLIDIGDLAGLYRVASFLGLGATLVGIGYLYQRFVFRLSPSGKAGNESIDE